MRPSFNSRQIGLDTPLKPLPYPLPDHNCPLALGIGRVSPVPPDPYPTRSNPDSKPPYPGKPGSSCPQLWRQSSNASRGIQIAQDPY